MDETSAAAGPSAAPNADIDPKAETVFSVPTIMTPHRSIDPRRASPRNAHQSRIPATLNSAEHRTDRWTRRTRPSLLHSRILLS
jgi:hypothetical protein